MNVCTAHSSRMIRLIYDHNIVSYCSPSHFYAVNSQLFLDTYISNSSERQNHRENDVVNECEGEKKTMISSPIVYHSIYSIGANDL